MAVLPEKRAVQNTCPECGAKSIYHLRHTYNNEGAMICDNCRAKAQQDQAEFDAREERLSQLAEDIRELKERGSI